jgi:hypothetical protein
LLIFCATALLASNTAPAFAADKPISGASNNIGGDPPPNFPLTKSELQSLRSIAAESSPTRTHAYDRAGTLKYLAALNLQFVSLEAIALLLDDYKGARSKLERYNRVLDACIQLRQKKMQQAFEILCAAETSEESFVRSTYYNFVDRVGYLSQVSGPGLIDVAMKPLISGLSEATDGATAKEAELAKLK